ncbi:MAG: LysR family transcriptional regulator [Devosia sp.]|nr:LysR family transcriptional regulator [Devosia sp.]
MELKQLRQFVTLAETLNFHRAALRLHIAQPALSVSLRKLEEDLGVRLFDRGRRGVALTSAGAAALADAYLTLEHAGRLRDQARAGSLGEVGTVQLGYVGTATYDLLPRLLAKFRAAFPAVQVELHEQGTGAICAGLAQGIYDIGIIRYPMAPPVDMKMEIVERDKYCLALPPGHRLEKRKRLALSELADEPFVFPSALQSPALYGTSMAACQAAGFLPRIAQEAAQLQTVIGLVRGGSGVALVPANIARNIPQRVEFRPLTDDGMSLSTGLALLCPIRRMSRAAGHFRDLALELAGAAPAAGPATLPVRASRGSVA